MMPFSCVYAGTVVHKRLTPKPHGFAYRVFSLCLDLDEIDRLDRDLKLFSRNRWNLLSFHDRDYGAKDTIPVAEHARSILRQAGLADAGHRIQLLCYPRILGFVFNPLSVYFCHDAQSRLAAVIYEVSNTFHERKSYVIAVDGDASLVSQTCAKELYVSPFTAQSGSYSFHLVPPSETTVVGVAFREAGVPVLKTHFRGVRETLSDRAIGGLLCRYPLMTLKVVAGIHIEAARLWLKGVPLVVRHTSPKFSFTRVKSNPHDAT